MRLSPSIRLRPAGGIFRQNARIKTEEKYWKLQLTLRKLFFIITFAVARAISYRCVAQFGRALRSGRRGRRFKSCRIDFFMPEIALFYAVYGLHFFECVFLRIVFLRIFTNSIIHFFHSEPLNSVFDMLAAVFSCLDRFVRA